MSYNLKQRDTDHQLEVYRQKLANLEVTVTEYQGLQDRGFAPSNPESTVRMIQRKQQRIVELHDKV